MNGEERIWYIFISRQRVKLDTMGNQGEGNPVEGRSELETETIIWHFPETLLSCIAFLTSWRHALKPTAFYPICATLTNIYTCSVTGPLFRKKELFSIVHFTTGNVEVRRSVDHSGIYGSRCTFKCKLIFTVGGMRHNNTDLQNPKSQIWTRSKKIFLTTAYSTWIGFYLEKNLTLLSLKTRLAP